MRSFSRVRPPIAVVLVLPLIFVLLALGQEAKNNLVLFDVLVLDGAGQRVAGLTKDDFVIAEGNMPQHITHFSAEASPVNLGFVVDSSGSMKARAPLIARSASGALRQLRDDDVAFVSQYKSEPELIQDFTSDKRALVKAFGEVFFSSGTALLDAIIVASDYSREHGKLRRKAVLLITDGLEKNSSIKESVVREALIYDQVQVYFICMFDEQLGGKLSGKTSNAKAKDMMTRLVEVSGGRAFFPLAAEEATGIAAGIVDDLHSQYLLGYTSTNTAADGAFREVNISVSPKDSRPLTVISRKGYFAPGYVLPDGKNKKSKANKEKPAGAKP